MVGVNMCTYVCACVETKVRYPPHPLPLYHSTLLVFFGVEWDGVGWDGFVFCL